jgi:hypothetical protein
MQNNLATVKQLQTQHSALKNRSGVFDSQISELETKRRSLENKLKSLEDVTNTYDREYLDRLEGGESAPSFWRARGLNTTADWALAVLYFAYFFVVVVVFVYVATYSTKKVFGSLMVLVFGFIGTMMITAFLVRFA